MAAPGLEVEDAVQQLLEHLRGRFYGKYRGVVTDVEASTCRVKALVPAVLGAAKSGWCMPCVPYAGPKVGIAFLPEAGSGVWIEFEGGDISYPIWSGCYWRKDEVPADVDAQVKVIVTKAQLELKLDDKGKSITVTDPNGNKLTIDKSGITVANGGQQVVVSSSKVSVNNGALEAS
jgi:uncharacterized protein involved in type VI secretion and phage assembly